MAGVVLNSSSVLRLDFSAKLNICASISATSPSCETLCGILKDDTTMVMTKEQQRELIDIKNQIAKHFSKSDWLDLGYTLGSYDVIEGHPRLLRSLSFGDDDYEGNILEVLTEIIKKDPKNFNEIKSHLSEKFSTPVIADLISTAHKETPKRVVTFSPQVFDIPSKPQNDKLVTVMLPFKQQKSFEAVKLACNNLHLDCAKADDIWENPLAILRMLKIYKWLLS